MFEGGGGVEEMGVYFVERAMVVVDYGVPELGGVAFGHFHNLCCIAVADEVSLG